MMRSAVLFFLCFAFAGHNVLAAKKTGSRHDPLRIAGTIPGWQEAAGGYVPFDHDGLFDLINGGAPEYIDAGMVRGSFQRLAGQHGASIEVYAFDFGAPEKSRAMQQARRSSIDSITALPGFDTSRVAARALIGAVVAYGAFGSYYFEATIQGVAALDGAIDALRKVFLFLGKSSGGQ